MLTFNLRFLKGQKGVQIYTTDTDFDSIRKNEFFDLIVFELDQLIDIDSITVNYSNVVGIYHTIGHYNFFMFINE